MGFVFLEMQTNRLVTAPSLAVVEWYSYPPSMETNGELRRASNRLAGLVRLTSMQGIPDTLRILKGICFVESGNFLGLVSRLPDNANPTKQPVSLFSLIQRKGEAASDLRPPPLEARIRLSQQLAGSLHSFGLARWFHKDFNCRNIVFFRSKLVPSSVMLESPYITGFSISRPDAPNEVSLNKDHENLSVYLHPDLRTRDHSARPKYSRKYDVYSLGLVLLEIGLWRTLTPMIKSDLSPPEFKSQATRRCQRDLAFFTGSGFRDIVMRCLTCADEDSDETASSLDNFYFSVVLELVRLSNTSGS